MTAVCSLNLLLSSAGAQIHKDSTTTMKNYTVLSGNSSLTVQPDAGARIVSFKSGRYEFLTGKEIHADNYGSTFWPSPQSLWNWPPPHTLDSDPYKLENAGGLLRMKSGKDPQTGLQFTKEFASAQNGKIRLTYSILNAGDTTQKTAPWDISRLHKGGLLFFQLGEGSVGVKQFAPVPTEVLNGIVWFQDGKERPKENELSIANTSGGWAAFAVDGKIFIKKFAGITAAQQAPGRSGIVDLRQPRIRLYRIRNSGSVYDALSGKNYDMEYRMDRSRYSGHDPNRKRKQRTHRVCTRNNSINFLHCISKGI